MCRESSTFGTVTNITENANRLRSDAGGRGASKGWFLGIEDFSRLNFWACPCRAFFYLLTLRLRYNCLKKCIRRHHQSSWNIRLKPFLTKSGLNAVWKAIDKFRDGSRLIYNARYENHRSSTQSRWKVHPAPYYLACLQSSAGETCVCLRCPSRHCSIHPVRSGGNGRLCWYCWVGIGSFAIVALGFAMCCFGKWRGVFYRMMLAKLIGLCFAASRKDEYDN